MMLMYSRKKRHRPIMFVTFGSNSVSGILPGDLIICVQSNGQYGATWSAVGGGYTKVTSSTAYSGGSSFSVAVGYKFATTSGSVSVGEWALGNTISMVVYRNVRQTNPINLAENATYAIGSIPFAALIPSQPKSSWVVGVGVGRKEQCDIPTGNYNIGSTSITGRRQALSGYGGGHTVFDTNGPCGSFSGGSVIQLGGCVGLTFELYAS